MDHWDKTPYPYMDASGDVRHGNPNQSSSNNANLENGNSASASSDGRGNNDGEGDAISGVHALKVRY